MFRQFKLALPQSILFALLPLCVVFLSGCQLVSALGFAPKPLPFDKNPACHFQRPEFSKDTPLQLLTPEAFKENTLACLSNESTSVEKLQYLKFFFQDFSEIASYAPIKPTVTPQAISKLWQINPYTATEPNEDKRYNLDDAIVENVLKDSHKSVNIPELLEWVALNRELATQNFETKDIWALVDAMLKSEKAEFRLAELLVPIEHPDPEEASYYFDTFNYLKTESVMNKLVGCEAFDRTGTEESGPTIHETPLLDQINWLVDVSMKGKKAIAITPKEESLKAFHYYLENTKAKTTQIGVSVITFKKLKELDQLLLKLKNNPTNRRLIKDYYAIINDTCSWGC